MKFIEKIYSLLIFFSVVLGLILGQISIIQTNAELFIIPLLIGMLYISFLQIPFKDFTSSFRNKKFMITAIIINFFWIPLFAYVLASLFLGSHPALFIGFIMLMVTPCTDWYLVFTGIAKGNLAISTAILPINLILQVLLLPVYLYLFANHTGSIQFAELMESIVVVILVPLILAFITKYFLFRRERSLSLEKISIFPIIFLCFAITAMFASQGELLLSNLDLLLIILIPLVLFFSINFSIGLFVSRQLQFPYADRVSLSLTTLARNSPIALAIALTAFPDEPLIALTLIVGPLLELPILAIITQLLLLFNRREIKST